MNSPRRHTCYEKATGATLNIENCALAVGTWDTACEIMGITYSEEMIIGVKIRKTVKQSALASWTRLASLVRTQAR